jgi:hypothetical protein
MQSARQTTSSADLIKWIPPNSSEIIDKNWWSSTCQNSTLHRDRGRKVNACHVVYNLSL